MNTIKRTIAATELLLVFLAALFMTALFVWNLQPARYEPAHTAQRLVAWFGACQRLDVFLFALPFVALVTGCATMLRSWRHDEALRRAVLSRSGDGVLRC